MNEFFKTVRSFILMYLKNQRCCSENTIQSYKTTLNLLVEYLRTVKQLRIAQIDFDVIDRDIIVEFLDWLETARGCSASSRNQRLMALRSFFKYAGMLDCTQVSMQLDISTVPLKNEAGKIVEFLSENALKALLDQPDVRKSAGIRDQFFMVLMYDTAARCGELLNMRVSDLRLGGKNSTAYLLGKGSKPRIVALLPKTVEHCNRYLKIYHPSPNPDAYLFYVVSHGVQHQMSADAVATFMKKYGDSARKVCPEIPARVHPHQLRHTRAIHYYRDGMPLALVAEQLGHASAESTKVYAYADSEMKRAAMQRTDQKRNVTPQPTPIWQNDEDMILRLSGLK
jgi:integrase/recombinase XerD